MPEPSTSDVERLEGLEVIHPQVIHRFDITRRAWCIIQIMAKDDPEVSAKAAEALASLSEIMLNGAQRLGGLKQAAEGGAYLNHDTTLATLENHLRAMQRAADAHRCIIMSVFGPRGKSVLEEAEKQIIAEEEISAQGQV